MAGYLLISSVDHFDDNETKRFHQLAIELAKTDGPVTLFLVQNGVLSARAGECFAPTLRAHQRGSRRRR